jgi:hypothetical protein
MDFDPTSKSCSFCGMRGTSQTKFAGGLGAMMCQDCLSFYYEVFSSEGRSKAITRPPWDDMSDAELLSKLPLISDTSAQVHEFLSDWVQLARERKLSWAEIGNALGVSRQAAWERFSTAKPDKSANASA